MAGLRALGRLHVTREKTVVRDVNGGGIGFPGLSYGCVALERLQSDLGVVFSGAKTW